MNSIRPVVHSATRPTRFKVYTYRYRISCTSVMHLACMFVLLLLPPLLPMLELSVCHHSYCCCFCSCCCSGPLLLRRCCCTLLLPVLPRCPGFIKHVAKSRSIYNRSDVKHFTLESCEQIFEIINKGPKIRCNSLMWTPPPPIKNSSSRHQLKFFGALTTPPPPMP